MKTIGFVVPYFGPWPEWFEFFLLSVAANSSIQWLFFGDHAAPASAPANAVFRLMSFADYQAWASSRLQVDCRQGGPYKLCDLKPFYGYLHEADLRGFDYYGFTDIDVIYGNLRAFLTENILTHQVISALRWRICGHFTLFKNCEQNRRACFRMKGWRACLESPRHDHITEGEFSRVYYRRRRWPALLRLFVKIADPLQRNVYFRDQFATPLVPWPWENGSWTHPHDWQWQDGRLTNNVDGPRERLYLHFMNWKNARYLPPMWGAAAAWTGKRICNVSVDDARRGFRITPDGFFALSADPLRAAG